MAFRQRVDDTGFVELFLDETTLSYLLDAIQLMPADEMRQSISRIFESHVAAIREHMKEVAEWDERRHYR